MALKAVEVQTAYYFLQIRTYEECWINKRLMIRFVRSMF
jgi:hypothetical protein